MPRIRRALNCLFPVPPELKAYTLWVIWAGVTGPLVAVDLDNFWTGYRVLAQMFVMVWVAYAILTNLRNVDVIFLATVLGVMVQAAMVYAGAGSVRSIMGPAERVMGHGQVQVF